MQILALLLLFLLHIHGESSEEPQSQAEIRSETHIRSELNAEPQARDEFAVQGLNSQSNVVLTKTSGGETISFSGSLLLGAYSAAYGVAGQTKIFSCSNLNMALLGTNIFSDWSCTSAPGVGANLVMVVYGLLWNSG